MFILMLVAAILAGFIVYLLFRNRFQGRITELEEENAERASAYNSLENQYTSLQADHNDLDVKYRDLTGQINGLEGATTDLEAALKECRDGHAKLKADYDGLLPRATEAEGKLTELQREFDPMKSQLEAQSGDISEIESLKARLSDSEKVALDRLAKIQDMEKLKSDLQKSQEKVTTYESKLGRQGEKIAELTAQLTALPVAEPAVDTSAMDAELKQAQDKLSAREAEIKQLREQLELAQNAATEAETIEAEYAALKAQQGSGEDYKAPYEEALEKIKHLEAQLGVLQQNLSKEETELARIKARAGEINFGRIGVASIDQRDDLKRIKGIGPFIEKKLNSIGIYTFDQISRFTPEDEEKVNEVIEFFPGRIRRDNWTGQGKDFADEKEKDKK